MKRLCLPIFLCIWLLLSALAPFALAGVVVVDPGHGGLDNGAVGPGGRLEKEVALSIGKKLATLFENSGIDAPMTRTDDTYIPLVERTAFANDALADVFISIHANSAVKKGAKGVETFFQSLDATDETALALAETENSAYAPAEAAPNDDVEAIIDGLAQNAAHHLSSLLAETVQTRLVDSMRTGDRGVKQAPFIVLTGATMPAILVEVGFLSNPNEEARISREAEQDRIAKAIFEGVVRFLDLSEKKEGIAANGRR